MDPGHIRNVAVVAHVDHGKTTLVDRFLYESGMFREDELSRLAGGQHDLIMDSNPIERERGITIFAKNCAIDYRADNGEEYRINIIDTPGHADFGGEVERVLSMADGVLLLVEAFEGPMPQTRFVLQKALQHGLRPIVVVNKVDRPDARPHQVVDEVFDLLVDLGADDHALDFPILFASAKEGWASKDLDDRPGNVRAVLEAIVAHVPLPVAHPDEPLRLLVTTLDSSEYVGRIAIGRVRSGKIEEGQDVVVFDREGRPGRRRVLEVRAFSGLSRTKVPQVGAGDLCAVVGVEPIHIGDTIACAETPGALPPVTVEEPTLHMTFRVNDGPFAGKEGKYVTSRQIRERLEKELQSNVALRVVEGETPEEFSVSGRGLMHLGILLENMRREGYELCVGKPRVVTKEVGGKLHEPIERLVVDCPIGCQSAIMSLIGNRRAEIVKMDKKTGTNGYMHLEFTLPARGLIGLGSRILTATQGQAIFYHSFEGYDRHRGSVPQRSSGVLISTERGKATSYALDLLADRGAFFVSPGEDVYEGQIVGEHSRENDIAVNPTRTKKLTNMRAAGKDDAAQVRPVRRMSLEAALEYIQEDELVEVTPKAIRLRKRLLSATDRKRMQRAAGSA